MVGLLGPLRPVGDLDDRRLRQIGAHPDPHLLIQLGIQVGGELIEDEYAGAGEQGSRQGQTLPLAPGQGLAVLTHESVVAVLQGLNVLIDAGGSADPANLGVTGRRRCQAHVLGDRGSHEVDPLVHHADLLV